MCFEIASYLGEGSRRWMWPDFNGGREFRAKGSIFHEKIRQTTKMYVEEKFLAFIIYFCYELAEGGGGGKWMSLETGCKG